MPTSTYQINVVDNLQVRFTYQLTFLETLGNQKQTPPSSQAMEALMSSLYSLPYFLTSKFTYVANTTQQLHYSSIHHMLYCSYLYLLSLADNGQEKETTTLILIVQKRPVRLITNYSYNTAQQQHRKHSEEGAQKPIKLNEECTTSNNYLCKLSKNDFSDTMLKMFN